MKRPPKAALLFVPLVFLLIYYPVFTADYAYLDEIHQLWHNNDNSNFAMFHTQGRWLTGLLFQRFFEATPSIEGLKWLRLFSFAGWVVVTIAWAFIFDSWVHLLGFNKRLWWPAVLYFACSISVVVYIGWASCMEVFLGVAAALLSGHVLFKKLYPQQIQTHLSTTVIVLSLTLGITSLFIYQTAFGVFLLPFFLHYWQRKTAKPDKIVWIGIGFYLATYVFYYFLFQYSLKAYSLEASTRTAININLWNKLSFFFSGPLPQGFSINFLSRASSLLSQIFYPLVILVWLVSVFKRLGTQPVAAKLSYVVLLLALLAFMYLPLMIAAENFPSYRTLFAFNAAVYIMVIDALLYLFKSAKAQNRATVVACFLLIGMGIYTYQFQMVRPLQKEYAIFKKAMQQQYTLAIDTVHFIRADKQLFTKHFGTHVYRDELGAPSTYRDWVPEPIVKQTVFELTGNRQKAERINIVQYENIAAWDSAKVIMQQNSFLLNMNEVFKKPIHP